MSTSCHWFCSFSGHKLLVISTVMILTFDEAWPYFGNIYGSYHILSRVLVMTAILFTEYTGWDIHIGPLIIWYTPFLVKVFFFWMSVIPLEWWLSCYIGAWVFIMSANVLLEYQIGHPPRSIKYPIYLIPIKGPFINLTLHLHYRMAEWV